MRFSWTNAQPQDGDTFRYRYVAEGADPVISSVSGTEVVLERDPDGTSCILVSLVRSDGRDSNDAEGCVDG